jgi:2-dehydro-3-deoxy-L-rhamnonate dehydrogenase (NAD+)
VLKLHNRAAIITGAATGIGEKTALRMAEAGADIAVVDLDLTAAEQVSERIQSAGRRSIAIQCDVSNASDVAQTVDRVLLELGKIDILINNAGIAGRTAPISDVTVEEWNQVLLLDLTSVFLLCKAILPHMVQRGYGKIVNVASMAGKEGSPNMIPYSAAKAGVIALTKSLAMETVRNGIYVNCVAPALIDTALLRQFSSDHIRFLASKIPMGRLGRPEEVAAVIEFLASDDASFVTGQCYDVSGGRATY